MKLKISLAILLGLVTALPAEAAPAQHRAPRLMGRTVVTSDGSSSAVVLLTRDVSVSTRPFRNGTIEIESRASFASVVLREIARQPVEFMAFRVDACPKRACDGRSLRFSIVHDPTRRAFPEEVTLPGGRYVVDIVSDGAPVSAVVSFPELDGSTSITATGPAHGSAGDLPATVHDSTGRTFYSASTRHEFEGIGLSMVGVWLRANRHAITNADSCLAKDPLPGYATPILMSCLGSGSGVTFVTDDLGGGHHFMLAYGQVDQGSYLHSLTYEAVGTIEGMAAKQFSIDYGVGIRRSSRSGMVFGWGD